MAHGLPATWFGDHNSRAQREADAESESTSASVLNADHLTRGDVSQRALLDESWR